MNDSTGENTTAVSFDFPIKKDLLHYRKQTVFRMSLAAGLSLLAGLLIYSDALPASEDLVGFLVLVAQWVVQIDIWISSRPGAVLGSLVCVGLFLSGYSIRSLYSLVGMANDTTLTVDERCDKAISLYKANNRWVQILVRSYGLSLVFLLISVFGKIALDTKEGPEVTPTLLFVLALFIPLMFINTPIMNFLVPAELRARIYEQLPPDQSRPAMNLFNSAGFSEHTYSLDNLVTVVFYLMAVRDNTTLKVSQNFQRKVKKK